MEISWSKIIGYLPLVIVILGIGSMGAGLSADHPGYEVSYLTDYDEQYGEDQHQDNYARDIILNDSDDIEPSDIHRTYNISDFNNETQDKLRSIIGTDNKTLVYDSNITAQRIIVEVDDQLYVYEASRNGITPQQLGLLGAFLVLIGVGLQASIQSSKEKIPDEVERSDDGDWEYYPDE